MSSEDITGQVNRDLAIFVEDMQNVLDPDQQERLDRLVEVIHSALVFSKAPLNNDQPVIIEQNGKLYPNPAAVEAFSQNGKQNTHLTDFLDTLPKDPSASGVREYESGQTLYSVSYRVDSSGSGDRFFYFRPTTALLDATTLLEKMEEAVNDNAQGTIAYIKVKGLDDLGKMKGDKARDAAIHSVVSAVYSTFECARLSFREGKLAVYVPGKSAEWVEEQFEHILQRGEREEIPKVKVGMADIGKDPQQAQLQAKAAYTSLKYGSAATFDAANENMADNFHTRSTLRIFDRVLKNPGGENGELVLFYQAIELLDKSLQGPDTAGYHYEVLFRYRDANGKIHSPGPFIEAAQSVRQEELLRALDYKVLDTYFGMFAQLHGQDTNRTLYKVHLNVTHETLSDDGIVEYLKGKLDDQELKQAGLRAGMISLELTEEPITSELYDDQKLRENIGQLRDLGFHVGVDDYGTGMNTLSRTLALQKAGADYAKLDMSLAAEKSAVDSFVKFTRGKQMGSVSEGLENGLLEIHQQSGVQYGQGWEIHKAEPLENLRQKGPHSTPQVIQDLWKRQAASDPGITLHPSPENLPYQIG